MVSIRMRPSFAIKEDCKIVIFICAMEFATTNKGQHELCEACIVEIDPLNIFD